MEIACRYNRPDILQKMKAGGTKPLCSNHNEMFLFRMFKCFAFQIKKNFFFKNEINNSPGFSPCTE